MGKGKRETGMSDAHYCTFPISLFPFPASTDSRFLRFPIPDQRHCFLVPHALFDLLEHIGEDRARANEKPAA
jgi:hypothetical protein